MKIDYESHYQMTPGRIVNETAKEPTQPIRKGLFTCLCRALTSRSRNCCWPSSR